MAGYVAQTVVELVASGERAVEEVRREVGHDPDEPGDLLAYVAALEGKVREQAMALRIAGVVIDRTRE